MPTDTLIEELLAEHNEAKKSLNAYKEKERKIRDVITSLLFSDAKKGTNKVSLKNLGLEIKVVIKENWSVKQEGLSDLLAENDGMQRAFKYKHELIMAGYNSLNDAEKIILADNLTCKQASPELTYEGELPISHLSSLSSENGKLLVDGEIQHPLVADQIAMHYGFSSESLLTFLDQIA